VCVCVCVCVLLHSMQQNDTFRRTVQAGGGTLSVEQVVDGAMQLIQDSTVAGAVMRVVKTGNEIVPYPKWHQPPVAKL
jgi:hypothetical protein